MNVEMFYNQFSVEYTASVAKCNPYYIEMIQNTLDYLPGSFVPQRILELGCGSGNQTIFLEHHFPQAKITAIDLSEELLAICGSRLKQPADLIHADISTYSFPQNAFELVFSALTIHHLSQAEKQLLFGNIHATLHSDGYFLFADRFRSELEMVDLQNKQLRKKHAFENGATDKEWNQWAYHERTHDRPDTLFDQIQWLKNVGFSKIDCLWRKAAWGLLCCAK